MFRTNRGSPFGGALERGVPWFVWEPRVLWLGAAAAISRACSLPDPLHLTHFLFFTQCLQTISCQSDPHQNIYNYLPAPRTSARPRTSGSIPNCSHTSHLQLFCHQNCPDSRGSLGNWISSCFQIKVLRWQSTEAKEQASYRCEAKATRNGKPAPVIIAAFWARTKAVYCLFFFNKIKVTNWKRF